MAVRVAGVFLAFLAAILVAGVYFLLNDSEPQGQNPEEELVLIGRVTRIVDGDTIDVQLDSGVIRVRMQGIDTPERGQPMFTEASAALRDLVGDKPVELLPSGQFSFERMVARVYADGNDVNAEMIKGGFAMAERRFLHDFEDGDSYCAFEHSARSEGLGIWPLPAEQRVAPWEWRRRKDIEQFRDYGGETVETCVAAIGGR